MSTFPGKITVLKNKHKVRYSDKERYNLVLLFSLRIYNTALNVSSNLCRIQLMTVTKSINVEHRC